MPSQQSDPLQNFIAQFMSMNQFLENRRQFDQSQLLQQRQVENSEMQNFAQLAGRVQNPEELDAVAQFFSSRNPEMADTFENLRTSLVPAMETMRASAAQKGYEAAGAGQDFLNRATASAAFTGQSLGQNRMDQVLLNTPEEELQTRAAIAGGTALSKVQQKQLENIDRQFNEDVRRFGVQTAQQNRELALRAEGLDIQREGNQLQRMQIEQTGAMQMMGFQTQAGLLPEIMRTDIDSQIGEMESQLDATGANTPAGRAIANRIAQAQESKNRLDTFIANEMAKGRGGSGLDVSNLPGLMETYRKLQADLVSGSGKMNQDQLNAQMGAIAATRDLMTAIDPRMGAIPLQGPISQSPGLDAFTKRRSAAPGPYDFMFGSTQPFIAK